MRSGRLISFNVACFRKDDFEASLEIQYWMDWMGV